MCLSCEMKVKAAQEGAPSFVRVPCGHCKECDEVYRKGWQFRLRVELEALSDRDWQCGFCTLTYSDACLPHYPVEVFTRPDEFRSAMCFSRDDCEHFVRTLRSWLWREYRLSGADACRYMLCSEYGSHTARSHYHFLIACPPFVDMRRLFDKIHEVWTFGHVFPRYFNGGKDSHGYNHKPFVVASMSAASKYCAKYATKDMYYQEHLDKCGFTSETFKKSRLYRRCAQFHLQSRSLGRSLLDGLDDAGKMRLLRDGYQFVGDDKMYTVPVYIRNKIVFDNRYIVEYEKPSLGQSGEDDIVFYRNPKRLVRREANAFFIEHYNEIFELKAKKYAEFFVKMADVEECAARGLDAASSASSAWVFASTCRYFDASPLEFARCYLACYGLPDFKRLHTDYALQWLSHYVDIGLYDFGPDAYTFDLRLDFSRAVNLVASLLFMHWYQVRSEYTDEDRLLDKIRDFFSSLE